MDARSLHLKKREERRVRQGHPWVFSNEVDVARSPLNVFAPGQPVDMYAHGGKFLATGYVNPHSLICARVVSRRPGRYLNTPLLGERVAEAMALRAALFAEPFYRAVFGESDGLPGLVVDRYGDLLVVQIKTAGMERLREQIVAVLKRTVGCSTILLRNDIQSRALEGLDKYVESAFGTVPEKVEISENGLRFEVAPLTGQKTGWYYDQRANRARIANYVRDKRVLDMFCYSGAWGIRAAAAGARQVTCVDSSEAALAQAARNALLNGVADRVDLQRGDAFDVLKSLSAASERFDVVVLDPPAFIRRKKDFQAGVQAYRRLNLLAIQVLKRDGVLISASCSAHLKRDTLLEILASAGRFKERSVQILEEGHQGPDHPVCPTLPESSYLKVFFARFKEY